MNGKNAQASAAKYRSLNALSVFVLGLVAAIYSTISMNAGFLIFLSMSLMIIIILGSNSFTRAVNHRLSTAQWLGRFRQIFKSLATMLPIAAIVLLLHLFYHPGRLIFAMFGFQATFEGLTYGMIYALKLMTFMSTALLLVYLVEPAGLILPLEKLARILGRRGAIIERLALSFLLAVRFFPEIAIQARLSAISLKARGFDSRGNLFSKAKFASLMLPPLVVNSLKRANLAALALEVKGYSTRHIVANLPSLKLGLNDLGLIIFAIFVSILGWRWT